MAHVRKNNDNWQSDDVMGEVELQLLWRPEKIRSGVQVQNFQDYK